MEPSSTLHINGRSHSYCTIILPLKSIHLISWLRQQIIYPKVYWKDRDSSLEIAALGSCLTCDQVPKFYSPLPKYIRFFGGISFSSEKKGDLWNAFPSCHFFLPAVEVMQTQEKTLLILRFIDEPSKETALEKLIFTPESPKKQVLNCLARHDLPNSSDWETKLIKSLSLIKEGSLEKIVLARCSSFHFNEHLEALDILERIENLSSDSTHFAYQINEESTFIGATPEKLYYRENNRIFSDALAGTRPRGSTIAEDYYLEKELLNSDKEKREFYFVKNFIHNNLFPLCSQYHWEAEDRVIKQPSVQHLSNRFCGTLRKHVYDRDLLELLHPTPALGGLPRIEALKLIKTLEPFDRGWYGGPIGWISADRASFVVGIRSALINKAQLHLFSGVGIVDGSDPKQEWDELEQKISSFKKVIYDACA